MARSIRVPLHVIKSKISASAKMLWIELALLSSPKKPQVAVDTKILAEKIGRSKATLSRLIRELEKAELLVHTGVVNRCQKTYNLVCLSPEALAKGEVVKKPEKTPVILTPTLSQIPVELHPEVIRIFKATPVEAEFNKKVMSLLKEHWEMKQKRPFYSPSPLGGEGLGVRS
ncbi:MAG: helix-turn-helix domain-containing protein [Myxococcaceae bacterium]